MLHATYAVSAGLAGDVPKMMAALCAYRDKVENGLGVGFWVKPRFPKGMPPSARIRPRFRQPCSFGGDQEGLPGWRRMILVPAIAVVFGPPPFGGRELSHGRERRFRSS